jgi:hypothetical protein
MATAAQLTANQANALRSTGPATPQGKAISSHNATRHGLSAAFSVLPHENADQFHELQSALEAEFHPSGEHATFLVGEMARARWRILRIERLQALAYEQALTAPGSASDPDACILTFLATGNVLDKLERYAAAARRDYYRAKRELQQSSARNRKAQSAAALACLDRYLSAPVPSSKPVQNEPNLRRSETRPDPLDNMALRL